MLYSKWTSLSLPTRNKIASDFGVEKKSAVHVVDNRVQDDGFKFQEIEQALSREAMQAFIGTEEKDIDVLFQRVVDIIEGNVPPIEVLPEVEAQQFNKEYEARTGKKAPVKDKKRGRPRKI